MIYHLTLLGGLIILALAAVMAQNILVSVIMLALLSATVSLIMFSFSAPWAAVFELTVCGGLITALFIITIGFIKKNARFSDKNRIAFIIAPLVAALTAIIGWIFFIPFFEALSKYPHINSNDYNLGKIIWENRNFDLLGQIIILSAGVFVIKSIFFRSARDTREKDLLIAKQNGKADEDEKGEKNP